MGLFVPTKGSGGLGLVLAIDGNGVMGRGAAEAITFGGAPYIGEGAGICEDEFVVVPQDKA